MPETGAIDQRTHDVPLPPGATVAGDWDQWDYECRILYGTEHRVLDDVFAHAVAVQLPDGTFEHADDGRGGESPSITVQCAWEENLSIEQARALARAINDAADQLESWTGVQR